jgi:hypothetical protein
VSKRKADKGKVPLEPVAKKWRGDRLKELLSLVSSIQFDSITITFGLHGHQPRSWTLLHNICVTPLRTTSREPRESAANRNETCGLPNPEVEWVLQLNLLTRHPCIKDSHLGVILGGAPMY